MVTGQRSALVVAIAAASAVVMGAVGGSLLSNMRASSAEAQEAPYQIGVVVVDAETGQPVEEFFFGAAYYVASETGPGKNYRISRHIQDPQGSFVLGDLPRTAVSLAVAATGYGQAVAFVITEPRVPTEIQFRLERSAWLMGEVVDRIGLPVGGATVTVEYQDRLKDRLAQVADVVEQARSEGLRVQWFESETRSVNTRYGADEEKPAGIFRIDQVDPNRPLRLVATHPELGVAMSDVMTLEPGAVLENIRLRFR